MADFPTYLGLGGLVVGAPAAFLLYKKLKSKPEDGGYLAIARRKRQIRDSAIQAFAIHPTPPRDKQALIGNSTVVELKHGLEIGLYSSEDLLLTFAKRCSETGLELEAIGDVNFEEALQRARECDRERKAGRAEGLLFGIPVSVKDVFHMKGLDSTCGMTAHCFQPQAEDGLAIQLLKSQGAIPFVKTNLPFGVLSLESENRIWGNTKNPWNKSRSAGGSSGGEAALIATGCSVLGLANDFGGSIRFPSAVTGIYGFMCTGERGTSHGDHRVTSANGGHFFPYAWSRLGPMARCVDDLVLLMKSLWAPEVFQRDRLIPRLPFNDAIYQERTPKVIAVVENSLWELPLAVKRALNEAAEALRAAGHTIVQVDIDMTEVAVNFFQMLTSGDSWNRIGEVKGSEPWFPSAQQKVTLTNLPAILQKAVYAGLSAFGNSKLVSLIGNCGVKSAYDLMEVLSKRNDIVKKVIGQLKELGAEAVLMPAAIVPAPGLGKGDRSELANVHIFAAAHLTLPSGVVPITLVRPDEQVYPYINGDIVAASISESLESSAGLPIGVQICALPFHDELCLRIMKDLEREIRFSQRPPA